MHLPEYVNSVGGWAGDLVQILWPGARVANDRFEELNAAVMRAVNFPCVIFAQFSFGIVAIDCNDCDTWQVVDDSIALYVKLQFRPEHRYPNRRTVPFSYLPQNPSRFLRDLPRLRATYVDARRDSVAWGRFIAVSLDRYYIAHAMRKLGIPGGCYCTCSEGYEDHALDQVKPRHRMDFDEYIGQMNKAASIVDAKGFGDLTHRTIESLAIGVPLIRPRLDVRTANPLIAGVHYLDCGDKGENLAECLDVIRHERWRENLILNGQDWFEDNGRPESLRRLLDLAIKEAGFD